MSQAMVFSIAILAGGSLAACGDGNHDEVEASAIELGTTRGQGLQAQAAQDFPGSTDAEAIGKAAAVVFAINTGEMAQAHHVLSKSGNVAVRSLATRIIADHQASSATLQSLLGNRNLAPIETSVSRTLIAESNASFLELQAGPLRIINIDYSQIQIAMHQEASVIVATVRDYMPATAIDLRGVLSDALSMLDQHLTRAETVLRDLP